MVRYSMSGFLSCCAALHPAIRLRIGHAQGLPATQHVRILPHSVQLRKYQNSVLVGFAVRYFFYRPVDPAQDVPYPLELPHVVRDVHGERFPVFRVLLGKVAL